MSKYVKNYDLYNIYKTRLVQHYISLLSISSVGTHCTYSSDDHSIMFMPVSNVVNNIKKVDQLLSNYILFFLFIVHAIAIAF